MSESAIYRIRLPHNVKEALPEVAKRYNMSAPEMVRAILGMIVSGQVKLTLLQEDNRRENND